MGELKSHFLISLSWTEQKPSSPTISISNSRGASSRETPVIYLLCNEGKNDEEYVIVPSAAVGVSVSILRIERL